MHTVYKVGFDGTYCILFNIQDALDMIKCEIEDNYSKEDELEYSLSVVEMSDEEIEKAGEFEGF